MNRDDYTRNLVGAIVEASEGCSWEEARREWDVIDCVEDPDMVESCVCGHEHLRYLYSIRNGSNGNVLFPIGSSCIKKFYVEGMDEDVKCWQQAFRLLHEVERLGKGATIDLCSGFFSRKLLWFIYEQGAFLDNEYNEWSGYNDYRFLLDMFNRQSWTEGQARKVHAVMRNSVYPWLRNLWRETRRSGLQRESETTDVSDGEPTEMRP